MLLVLVPTPHCVKTSGRTSAFSSASLPRPFRKSQGVGSGGGGGGTPSDGCVPSLPVACESEADSATQPS